MSKRDSISRHHLIIKKLRTKPYSTYEELESYIDHQLKYDDSLNIGFSKRTLQRDIKEIYTLYSITIEYSKAERGYCISHEAENENAQRMMEAFDVFNSLNIAQDLTPYIHIEKRRPQGTEHLYGLLHAIKNKYQIKFNCEIFWEDEVTPKIAEPYLLKEFKHRWYVLAKDIKDENIKRFALDRIFDLEITRKKFSRPKDFNIEEYYRYCFGIISPDDINAQPKEIVLSFEPYQGKYIKTLPLHETQQIVVDNEEELRIKLKLHITHDFIMELLSYGENVEVLAPALLIKKVKESHKAAAALYQ